MDSAEETGLTFIENAIQEARHAAQITGLPAIADDSGIAVDALGGAPGIYSARYSGEDATDQQNTEKLLRCPEGRPGRPASGAIPLRAGLSAACGRPDAGCLSRQLAWGHYRQAAGNGGFGYDPIFYVPSAGKTAAELSREEKRDFHRGRALKLLLEALRNG